MTDQALQRARRKAPAAERSSLKTATSQMSHSLRKLPFISREPEWP
jgi:hypothetical protein